LSYWPTLHCHCHRRTGLVLLTPYFMNRTLPFFLAKLLQFQFRHAFCYAYTGSIVSLGAILTLKPHIFSFGFFSHKIYPCPAGLILKYTKTLSPCQTPALPPPITCKDNANIFVFSSLI